MIFIILIIVGILGMAGTVYLSSGIAEETAGNAPWYVLHPENFQSGLTKSVRIWMRNMLRKALIFLIRQYRKASEKIRVKETLKQKIRSFLYEHEPGGIRHPSEFWGKVRHPKKRSPDLEKEDRL